MPIRCPLRIPPLSDTAFAEIDHAVMACAYASQNSMGRRCDERIYENDVAGCEALRRQMGTLLADWGAYLEAQLYEEALVHFSGGETICTSRVTVARDGLELGTHRTQCHADRIAFLVTAMTQEHHDYEQHLLRLLRFTRLQGIQWINLNHANIEFITLRNGKGMEAGE